MPFWDNKSVLRQDFDVIQAPYLMMLVHPDDNLDWNHAKVARALEQRFRSDLKKFKTWRTLIMVEKTL
jgi:hypothetical protein